MCSSDLGFSVGPVLGPRWVLLVAVMVVVRSLDEGHEDEHGASHNEEGREDSGGCSGSWEFLRLVHVFVLSS